MTGLSRYYISRAFVSLAFGVLFALAISPWWLGALSTLLVFSFFLWAPHSGRYAVQPGRAHEQVKNSNQEEVKAKADTSIRAARAYEQCLSGRERSGIIVPVGAGDGRNYTRSNA